MKPFPLPTTQNGRASRPSGASSTAATAAGITTMPIAGTAKRLASRPYCPTRLKWKAEIGAVATPAISEVISTPMTGRASRQPGAVWVCRHQACPRRAS